MPGLGVAYAVAAIVASLPWVAGGLVVAWLAIRTARRGPLRPSWLLALVPLSVVGVVIGIETTIGCGPEHGVPPCWIRPLDLAAICAAGAAIATTLLGRFAGPRAASIAWSGPVAAVGLLAGMVVGLFVLPSIPAVGMALAEASCDRDPWCLTETETTEAEREDGSATLWIEGFVAIDGETVGARCELLAPEDGHTVKARFGEVGSTVDVELAVTADGTYRHLSITSGQFMGFPGKGWEPDTAVTVDEGTTPAAGRMAFLGIVDAMETGASVSGEVAWECPGVEPGSER